MVMCLLTNRIDVQANSRERDNGKGDNAPKQVAIVIDDFGNDMLGTEDMLKLPIKITVAVMPFMPTTKRDAEDAFHLGHDVLVHLPMEPVHGKKEWLGPGAITTDLSDAEIRRRVEAAIDDVPHAVGMNNHMGSKATADARVMKIVLGVCRERNLFFLDSRTTYKTVIPDLASKLDVTLLSNDVFLDDQYTTSHIMKQLGLLRKHLLTEVNCIAIGHVGPPGKKTAAAISRIIPELTATGAEFVVSSQLLDSLARDKQILP
ncbi:divergent polysaccharide deacetylase family protein [Paenibacillaceae bacterium]|nr:divergent polysaccharide deacetylase family protein [Paenibacillaceae bacterium]